MQKLYAKPHFQKFFFKLVGNQNKIGLWFWLYYFYEERIKLDNRDHCLFPNGSTNVEFHLATV